MRIASLLMTFTLILAGCDDSASEPREGDEPVGEECTYPSDCAEGDCREGACVEAAACLDYLKCPQADQICIDGRCVVRCDTDTNCGVEGHCFEGECQAWPLDLHANPPYPEDATVGELRAGAATLNVDPPIGISMAGFGFRDGPIAPLNPYARSMGGSSFMWDRPNVKVITLDNGKERLAVVRMPMCYVTDFVRTAIVKELLDRGRTSYEERITLVSNHSHSYPGRYWRLLPGLGFEAFGYGEFSQSWFNHLVQRTADAVEASEDSLRPAALAHTTDADFDPGNKISRDRRRENARFKDPRMMAIRIDDVSGDAPVPMAVMVEFAMHGTVMENEGLSADAGGAVEYVTEDRLEAEHGGEATVIYINGSAGDVSPGGDYLGHQLQPRLELIGEDTADILLRTIEPLVASRDVELAQEDRRFPITRETIGYAEGEFYKVPFDEFDQDAGEFKYGAFQCSRDGDEDPETQWSDGTLDCMFSVELANSRRPIFQYSKTLVSALRIGDMHVVTLPGEPSSRLGFDLAEAISTRYGLSMDNIAVWGYAQDHQLYLTPQDDWLQGGYNPSMSIWGFRFGDFIGRQAEEAMGALVPDKESQPAPQGVYPVWYAEQLDTNEVTPTTTPGTPGEVLEEVPETVQRFSLVRMQWRGGHPGAGPPDVVLQREDPDNAGQFAPFMYPAQKPYTDQGLRMVVRYEGRWGNKNPENDEPDEHPWSLSWEELGGFPTGRYRFSVTGQHWTGEAAEGYATTSRAFELTPLTDAPMLDPVWDAATGKLTAAVAYPNAAEGSYRLRSRVVRFPGGGAPSDVDLQATPADATVTSDAADPLKLAVTVTLAAPPAADADVAITVSDALGNSWRWTPPTE